MIKSKHGELKIKGDQLSDILADFITIVHGLKDMLVNDDKHPEEKTDALLELCFKLGLKSEDKLEAEMKEAFRTGTQYE